VPPARLGELTFRTGLSRFKGNGLKAVAWRLLESSSFVLSSTRGLGAFDPRARGGINVCRGRSVRVRKSPPFVFLYRSHISCSLCVLHVPLALCPRVLLLFISAYSVNTPGAPSGRYTLGCFGFFPCSPGFFSIHRTACQLFASFPDRSGPL